MEQWLSEIPHCSMQEACNLTAYRATVNQLIINIPKPGLDTKTLPNPKDIPPPLDRNDYPNIQFWTSKAFDTYCKHLSGETDGLAILRRRRGRRRNDDDENRYPYLENADGTPISWQLILKLGQKARRVWRTLLDVDMAPASWGKASETAYNFFNSEILNTPELKFLRYCEGNWKVMRWATKAYASWAHNHIKSKDPVGTEAARGKKRKHDSLDNPSLLQIDNDKDEANVIAQSPEGPEHIQNAPTSEAAQTPPTPSLVPTQVSSHRIS